MTKHINPGYQDPRSYDVGIAVMRDEIETIKTENYEWFDRYGNLLFTSTPVRTTGDVAFDVIVEDEVKNVSGMPRMPEFSSVEALMFFAGMLDRMMRDAGY